MLIVLKRDLTYLLPYTAKGSTTTMAKLADTGDFTHTFACVLNNNFAEPTQLRMVGRGIVSVVIIFMLISIITITISIVFSREREQ